MVGDFFFFFAFFPFVNPDALETLGGVSLSPGRPDGRGAAGRTIGQAPGETASM